MHQITKLYCLVIGFICLLSCSGIASQDFQEPEKQSLDISVENAIEFWLNNEPEELKRAINNMVIKEATLMLTGDIDLTHYYIARLPRKLLQNQNALMGYIFLLYQANKKIDLRPVTFFQGESFSYIP